MQDEKVPVLDFTEFVRGTSRERRDFTQALGDSIARFGFVSIVGHEIPSSLIDEAHALALEVFRLPDAVKRRYETPGDGRQRGYTPFGTEHAKGVQTADLKEFWHVGSDQDVPGIPSNQYPDEVPRFAEVLGSLFRQLEALSLTLLDLLGVYLDQRPGELRQLAEGGNSVLRVIHYPDLPGVEVTPGSVRAAAHEDINLLTTLPASNRPGLELLLPDGRWIPVAPPTGGMIVDTGDMMELLTAGRLKATTHRVVNPDEPDGGRLSTPFFLHPRPEAVLRPMRADYGPSVTAAEFLSRRQRETGVAQ